MLPIPGTGEIILIVLLVLIVFVGEKVGAIGDAIGRARRGKTEDERIGVRDADADPRG